MTFVPYDEVNQVTQVFLVLQRLGLRNTQVLPAAREGWHGGGGGGKSGRSGARLSGFKF